MSAATGTCPQSRPTNTCPPWCVECWDLSGERPGSRYHHGRRSGPIPARVDLAGATDAVTVQASFCQRHPLLREELHGDDTAHVDVCAGDDWPVVMLSPADARRLAHELATAADTIDPTPSTPQACHHHQ